MGLTLKYLALSERSSMVTIITNCAGGNPINDLR
jgi:hypothetical protein